MERNDATAPPTRGTERRVARPQAALPVTAGQPSAGSGSDGEAEPRPRAGGGSFSPAPPSTLRFLAMGDYGYAGPGEQRVAELVTALDPDYVITTGDNNYYSGSAQTIDENIGQYFSELIYPYKGSYGSSATVNRFFPSLGNHDWGTPGAEPYLEYFTLPGNERYYDIVLGDVHLFAIDSDALEPDGNTADSVQGQWLKSGLAASQAAFDVVYMHHPPFSSCRHGNTPALQWPYRQWGADLVLAGHDHCYERFELDGLSYVVSGLGGSSLYGFGDSEPGSVARFSGQYGVLIFDADADEMRLAFHSVDGELVDATRIVRR